MIGWLRGLFRRRPPPLAPGARELVMHLADRFYRPVCGVPWSPADPITTEGRVVTCEKCKTYVRRQEIARIAKKR